MPDPKIDPVTAESEEQDADLASEHESTDVTGEQGGEPDHGGMTTGTEPPP
ncbi:hypothetical protein SAMN05216188_12678 [Lentzea xinjiangensis]|uniref:Uncharacterized protein n=1 Tax=Lentzea xinjiangensis TaxID=402600 RepID=A0A1H9VI35_9PSEU|nr:hypothetical protein [Lentzea xinjiangensis]SES21228.1 hypothetical protein SAMN05216188_12678 [Lentzea xinjiangensis]